MGPFRPAWLLVATLLAAGVGIALALVVYQALTTA